MSLSHTFSFKANPYVALQLGVPHPPKHSNFAPRPLQLHPPVLLTSRREEDETSCRSWWRVMSTSGAGGHHRTFARPSSSQGRFTSQQQPQPEQQPFHFSSLPITSNSNNNNRLQLHSQQQRRQHPGPAQGDNFVQTVELCKDEDTPSFGFNIKGGTEFGTAVHIWRVEENSLADRQGLRRGQQILQANGIDFTRISHSNALKVLKGRHYLKLLLDTRMNGGSSSSVVNKSASMVGDVSGYNFRPSSSQQTSSTAGMPVAWTWIDANGKIVPPPTPSSLINNKRMISLEINPGQSLGLLIRGGYEYGMGIYVTGVDHGSVAERGGLQRGDEILDVNGCNFTSITHDKAVQILKSCTKMAIVARYIGKIPADNQMNSAMPILDVENTELIDLGGGSSGVTGGKMLTTSMSDSMHHHNILMDSTNVTLFDDEDQDLLAEEEKLNDQNLELDYTGASDATNRLLHQDLEKSTSVMGMIEEKARTVLTKSEHSRFTFYRLEYQQGFLPIQTFVRILLELLNTVEKYTLLTEVREIIRPGDLISFDELIYNKEISIGAGPMGSKKMMHRVDFPQSQQQQQQQLQHHQNNEPMNMPLTGDPMLLPLVPVNQNAIINNPQVMNGRRLSPANNATLVSAPYNMNTLYNETTFTTNTTNTTNTPENNRQLLLTHGDTQNVVAKLAQQKIAQCNQPVFGGMSMPQQNVTPTNSCVRYKVRVQKTKPILGIAIEGGANTPHRLPRIIDVNTEGSAYGSQLKPGQVLLTVDGKKLDGLTHEEIARCILDSYVDMSKPLIEFVVVEAKATFVQSQHQLITAIPPPPGSNPNSVTPMGILPLNPGG